MSLETPLNINQSSSFNLGQCETIQEVLHSDACKKGLFDILTILYEHHDARGIYIVFDKLISLNVVSKIELQVLEDVISDKKFIEEAKIYLDDKLTFPEIFPVHNVTADNILGILHGYIVKAKINNIVDNFESENFDFKLHDVDVETREKGINIYEDVNVYIYKLGIKYYKIDKNNIGNVEEYDELNHCSKYGFQVKQGDNWGILDSKGNELIPCIWSDVFFRDSYFEVVDADNNKGACNLEGKQIIDCVYFSITYNKNFGYNVLSNGKNGKYGVKDFDGATILEDEFELIKFIEGKFYIPIENRHNEFKNIFDIKGKPLLGTGIENVKYDSKVGFIVENQCKYTFFDFDGVKIAEFELPGILYEDFGINEFIKGVGFIFHNLGINFFVNLEGSISNSYNSIVYVENIGFKTGIYKNGLLNLKGKEFLLCKYNPHNLKITKDGVELKRLLGFKTSKYSKEEINS